MATAIHPQNYEAVHHVPRPCLHLPLSNNLRLNTGKNLRNNQLNNIPYVTHYGNKKSSSSCYVEKNRKMYLVLDLDHTLVNSTPLEDLSVDENYLKGKITSGDASKRGLFRLESIGVMTKLRPFVHKFLYELSMMFEMYIYTMGDRKYALEMAKLLDPESKYFNSRIISREDCQEKNRKGLDLLGKPESSVLILDDSEKVWPNHKDNLIVMDKYMYFSSSFRQFGCKGKSLSELKHDEDELDGALSRVLQVLKRIHQNYLDRNVLEFDVRETLKNVRKMVLQGCKIVFSGIFPMNFQASEHKLWKMAEDLGATCCVDIQSDVTHVVSLDGGTMKSRWAIDEGKFLVHPRWVEAAYYLWERQLENKFEMSNKSKNHNNNNNNSVNSSNTGIDVLNNNINNKNVNINSNVNNTNINTNNGLLSLLEKEKLNETNFIDWYRNLRIALKKEGKEYVLEKPLPDEPNDSAPQIARDAFKIHSDDSIEVSCFMILTMNSLLQKQFENMEAYDMNLQLQYLFENEASMEWHKTPIPLYEPKLEKEGLVSPNLMEDIGLLKDMDTSPSFHDSLEKAGLVSPNAVKNIEFLKDMNTSKSFHDMFEKCGFVSPNAVKNINDDESKQFWLNLKINRMEKRKKKNQDMQKIAKQNNKVNKPNNDVLMVSKKSFKKVGKVKKPRKGKKVKFTNNGVNKPVVALIKPSPNKVLLDQKCFHCNESGHWKRNCFKYLKHIQINAVKPASTTLRA